MKIFFPTIISAFAVPTAALSPRSPNLPRLWSPGNRHDCLTQTTATDLVNDYASLFTNFTIEEANTILADDYTSISDSANFLIGKPSGSITATKESFIALRESSSSLYSAPFQVISIDVVGCTSIAVRLVIPFGGNKKPVYGISIYIAERNNQRNWQVKTAYSEFNSAVFVQDIGGSCILPKS